MAVKPIEIRASDVVGTHFDTRVELDGVRYTLVFEWNARAAAWYLSLWDEQEVAPILLGQQLVLARFLFSTVLPGVLIAAGDSLAEQGDLANVQLLYVEAESLDSFGAAVPS